MPVATRVRRKVWTKFW